MSFAKRRPRRNAKRKLPKLCMFALAQVQALALAPAGLVQCLFGTGPAQARAARYGKMKSHSGTEENLFSTLWWTNIAMENGYL